MKDDDNISNVSESTIKAHVKLLENILKINKSLLQEEEHISKLDSYIKKYDRNKSTEQQQVNVEVNTELSQLTTEMTKSACEMQHNEIVLEEILEVLDTRRKHLALLHQELTSQDQEHEMLQALLYSNSQKRTRQEPFLYNGYHTKEMLDTLV